MNSTIKEEKLNTIIGPCAADGQVATMMMASMLAVLKEQGVEEDTLRAVLKQIHKKAEKDSRKGHSKYGNQSEGEFLGKRRAKSKIFKDSIPTLEEFEFQTLGCGAEAGKILEICTAEFIKKNQSNQISQYAKKSMLCEIRNKVGSYTSFYDLRNPLKRIKMVSSDSQSSSGFPAWVEAPTQAELIRPFTDMWSRLHTVYCKEQCLTDSVCSMVYHATFDNTGQYIIVSVLGGSIKIFKKTGEIIRTLIGHKKEINILTLCPNNKYIISADEDSIVRIWEFPSGKPIGVLVEHQGQEISTLNMHQETQLVPIEGGNLSKIKGDLLLEDTPWKSFLLTASTTKGLTAYSEDQFSKFSNYSGAGEGIRNPKQTSIHFVARGPDNKPLGFSTAEINSHTGEIAAFSTTFRVFIWPRLRDCLANVSDEALIAGDYFIRCPPIHEVYTGESQNIANMIVLWSADGRYLVSSNEDQTRLVRFFSSSIKNSYSKKSTSAKVASCETLAEISSGLNSKAKKKQWIDVQHSTFPAINDKYLVTSFNMNQKKSRSDDEESTSESELVIYELESGKITHRINQMVTGVNMRTNVSCLVQSPTIPGLAITVDMEGQIVFWDCALGVALRIFMERATHLEKPLSTSAPIDCNFSPDGCYLVVSTSLGSYSIYGYGGSQWFEHVENQQFVNFDWTNFELNSEKFYLMKNGHRPWEWWEDKQTKMNIYQNPVNQALKDSLAKAIDLLGPPEQDGIMTPVNLDGLQLTLAQGRQVIDYLSISNQIKLKDYRAADEADKKIQEEILNSELERHKSSLEGIHDRIKSRIEYEAEQEQERLKQITNEIVQAYKNKLAKKGGNKNKNILFEGSDDDSQNSVQITTEVDIVAPSSLAGALALNRGETSSGSAGRNSGDRSEPKIDNADEIAESLVSSMARNLGVGIDAPEPAAGTKKQKSKKSGSKAPKITPSESTSATESAAQPAKGLSKLSKSGASNSDTKKGSSSSSRKKKKSSTKEDKTDEEGGDTATLTDSMNCQRCEKPMAHERCNGKGCQNMYHYDCMPLTSVERGDQGKICFGCFINLTTKNMPKTLLSSLNLEWINQIEKDTAKLFPQIGDEFYFIAQPYEEFVAGFFEILGFNSAQDASPWVENPALKLKDTKVIVEATKLEWPVVKEHQIMLKFQAELHVIMSLRMRVIGDDQPSSSATMINLKVKYLPVGKMKNRFLIWASTYETKVQQYRDYSVGKSIRTEEGITYKLVEKEIMDEVFGESKYNCMRGQLLDAIQENTKAKIQALEYLSPWEVEFLESTISEEAIDLSQQDPIQPDGPATLEAIPHAPKTSPVSATPNGVGSGHSIPPTSIRERSRWPVNLQPHLSTFLCLPEWKALLPADTNPKSTQLTTARPQTPTASTPLNIRDRVASGFYRSAEQLGVELSGLGYGATERDKDKARKLKVETCLTKLLSVLHPDPAHRQKIVELGKYTVGLLDPYNDNFSADLLQPKQEEASAPVGKSGEAELTETRMSGDKTKKSKLKGGASLGFSKLRDEADIRRSAPRGNPANSGIDEGENLFGDFGGKKKADPSPEDDVSDISDDVDHRLRMDPDGDDIVDDESSEGERIVDRVAKNATAASKVVEDKRRPSRREPIHTLINEEEWDATMRLGSGYERSRRTPYSFDLGRSQISPRMSQPSSSFGHYETNYIQGVPAQRARSGYIQVDDHFGNDFPINVDSPFSHPQAPAFNAFGPSSNLRPLTQMMRNNYSSAYPTLPEQNLLHSQYYVPSTTSTQPFRNDTQTKSSIKDTREK